MSLVENIIESLGSLSVQELGRVRDELDEVTRQRRIEFETDPDVIVEMYMDEMFTDDGYPCNPLPVKGGVLVATSVIYGKNPDKHVCTQATVRESAQAQDEMWVWDSPLLAARESLKVDGQLRSLHLVHADAGTLIGVHPMEKRPVKGKGFSAHQRDSPSYYRVSDVDSDTGQPELDYAFGIEARKLPEPSGSA